MFVRGRGKGWGSTVRARGCKEGCLRVVGANVPVTGEQVRLAFLSPVGVRVAAPSGALEARLVVGVAELGCPVELQCCPLLLAWAQASPLLLSMYPPCAPYSYCSHIYTLIHIASISTR